VSSHQHTVQTIQYGGHEEPGHIVDGEVTASWLHITEMQQLSQSVRAQVANTVLIFPEPVFADIEQRGLDDCEVL
jgi:hypothetical protein